MKKHLENTSVLKIKIRWCTRYSPQQIVRWTDGKSDIWRWVPHLKHITSHDRKTPASRSFIIHRKILIPKMVCGLKQRF